MNEEENITSYILHVDEVVNSIKGLGEYVEEAIVVQKVLRLLPSIFNPKILVIEETNDLDKLTMDELLGTLTAYEMRIENDNPPRKLRKEVTFKASKRTRFKISDFSNNKLDEEEANFFRKLKNMYKGKLPFKCFNCGKIRHFSHKCPYENTNVKENLISRKPTNED